jgi:bla regulator protein blaR1
MHPTAILQALQGLVPVDGNSILTSFRALSEHAAALAVTAVWQGTFIAGGLALCLRLVPRTSASHRFAVWAAAFVTLAGLPLLTLFSDFHSTVVAGVSSQAHELTAAPWLSLDARWSLAIAALWVAFSLLRAGDLAIHSLRLRKLWKSAIPVSLDSRLDSMLASTTVAWSRGTIQVCTTTTLQRPSVIGFFRPRILIPDWLLARLTHGELEQIVLHEAEHLRRRDDWTNLLQKICLVLFPLNPALLWIERRLCREREMACDDGVIRITNAPRAYAACLASLAERGLQRRAEALSLGAWQRRPELAHRVHSILRHRRALSPLGTRVLMGTLGCGLLFGSVELARCPQLVAFVPARNAEAAGPQAHLLNAARAPIQVAAIDRAPSGLKATAVASSRAASHLGSSNREARAVAVNASLQRPVSSRNAAPEWKTSTSQSTGHSPRTVMLKAELPGSHAAPAGAQYEEQWIVFTTWQQVQTSARNAGLKADYDASVNVDRQPGAAAAATSNANSRPDQQSASRITVTRLILRVLPAGSDSTLPGVATMRDGWLVIQL